MNLNPSDKPAMAGAKRNNIARHRRRWLPYGGAVLLVVLIVAGLWPQPAPVEIARATVGPLRATVNEEGKTRIRQRFVVSAPVAGRLRRIPLRAGDDVQAGETVVAVIDPLAPALLDERARKLAEARRDAASAQLEKARVARNFAAAELRRFEKLFAEKTVTLQELETAQSREASASRDEAAAASALREAEAELTEYARETGDHTQPRRSPTEVKAPAGGRVLRVFEESARVVASGTPLLEVGDPSELEVVIEVLSRDGAAITPGTRVELEQWGGSKPLEARVRLVEPAAFTKVSALGVEEQRVNVIADLLTSRKDRLSLGDNFRVEARIIAWENHQALKIPSGALFRRGEHWGVFVMAAGRAHLRPVQVGRSSGAEAQIMEGLKEGETVILYPGDRVKEGQRVRAIEVSR
ncbi:MAG: efflux RND transporter periplasmic adaptor subunit [Verrucomicrobia bacterium]|nr:efflux RND transporter periplasmic adaptor subunit [Verrucomicrobiota bacterium]